METSLHRQLKELYASGGTEVKLGRWRIDALDGNELIEVQHGSLAAIRDKIASLLTEHRVRVVKPIVQRKLLLRRKKPGGPIVQRRMSPKRGALAELFDELIYFTRVFPHPRLVLEVPLVSIEEHRLPRRGRRRWRQPDYRIEDQKLLAIEATHRFTTAGDLRELVTGSLPSPFDTAQLAAAMNIDRRCAQRVAYCFRQMGTTVQVGKTRNTLLYAWADDPIGVTNNRAA